MVEDMRFRIGICKEVLPGSLAFNIKGTVNFQIVEVLIDGRWHQITSDGARFNGDALPKLKEAVG